MRLPKSTNGGWQSANVVRMLEVALPFLPIAGEGKAHDELLSLIPDEIDIPPMTDRGVAGQVLDVAWPLCGGNHQDADFWNIFSFAVHLTLRVSSPGKDGGPEVEAVAKRIYEAMRLAAHAHDPERTTPEWVERGNSLMQEEARRIHGKIP